MQAVHNRKLFPQTVEEELAVSVLVAANVQCRGFLREIPDQHLIIFDDSHSSTLALVVSAVTKGGADLVRSHLEEANARWSR
jgi:hypothetical protein